MVEQSLVFFLSGSGSEAELLQMSGRSHGHELVRATVLTPNSKLRNVH